MKTELKYKNHIATNKHNRREKTKVIHFRKNWLSKRDLLEKRKQITG